MFTDAQYYAVIYKCHEPRTPPPTGGPLSGYRGRPDRAAPPGDPEEKDIIGIQPRELDITLD
jgi:hypothetical protein